MRRHNSCRHPGEIRAPAINSAEIAHVTVEHRYCGRYMLNKDFQQFLPRLQNGRLRL